MITATHPNGYSGVLYGKSSMIIRDVNGHEVLHTGSRTPQTEAELYEVLEGMPKLFDMLGKHPEMFTEEEEHEI